MAKLPDFRRILREDVKEAPSWIDRVINPVNLFFEQTYSAFNRNLTIGDNVSGQIQTITFTTLANYTSANAFTPIKFSLKTVSSPSCVMLGYIAVDSGTYSVITNPVTINWRATDPTTVQINYISGLANNTKYIANLLVL